MSRFLLLQYQNVTGLCRQFQISMNNGIYFISPYIETTMNYDRAACSSVQHLNCHRRIRNPHELAMDFTLAFLLQSYPFISP